MTAPGLPIHGADGYGAAFRAMHGSDLMRSLWAKAMGEQYPAEVEPFSSCSWWLLGRLVTELRLRPDAMLVDLGCGRGGPGLWLARAFSARLTSIDFSPAAVELARSRAAAFVEPSSATFQVGTFDATGLPDGVADGVVSMDGLIFAEDRPAAVREVHRVLAPGGRAAFTAGQKHPWREYIVEAGLRFEQQIPNPYHREHWQRIYALWTAHADGLRRELGDAVTDGLLNEAATVDELETAEAFLFVASRPTE